MNRDKELLIGAMHEIRQLRRINEILSAKVSVVEVFAAACGLRGNGGGMSIDIAWEIEGRIKEISTEEEKTPATQPM